MRLSCFYENPISLGLDRGWSSFNLFIRVTSMCRVQRQEPQWFVEWDAAHRNPPPPKTAAELAALRAMPWAQYRQLPLSKRVNTVNGDVQLIDRTDPNAPPVQDYLISHEVYEAVKAQERREQTIQVMKIALVALFILGTIALITYYINDSFRTKIGE